MRALRHLGGPGGLVLRGRAHVARGLRRPGAGRCLGAAYQLGWLVVPGVLVYRALSPRAGSILGSSPSDGRSATCSRSSLSRQQRRGRPRAAVRVPGAGGAACDPGHQKEGGCHGGPDRPREAAARSGWRTRRRGRAVASSTWGVGHFILAPLPGHRPHGRLPPGPSLPRLIAAEAQHHWPLQDSQMVEGAARVPRVRPPPRGGDDPGHGHRSPGRLLPAVSLPMLVLVAIQMAWRAGRSTGNRGWEWRGRGFCCWSGSSTSIRGSDYATRPFSGLLFADLHDSPSSCSGLVFFVPAVVLIVELTAGRACARPGRGRWWRSPGGLRGCQGLDAAGPGRRSRPLRPLGAASAGGRHRSPHTAAEPDWRRVMAGSSTWSSTGGTQRHRHRSLCRVDSMIGVASSKPGWGARPLLWAGPLLGAGGGRRSRGAPGRPAGGHRRADPTRPCAGAAARLAVRTVRVGPGGLHPDRSNRAFFLFYGYAAGVLLSAEGLVDLLARVPRERLRWLAPVVLVWLAFLLAAGVLPLLVFDPHGATENGALYAGWCAC